MTTNVARQFGTKSGNTQTGNWQLTSGALQSRLPLLANTTESRLAPPPTPTASCCPRPGQAAPAAESSGAGASRVVARPWRVPMAKRARGAQCCTCLGVGASIRNTHKCCLRPVQAIEQTPLGAGAKVSGGRGFWKKRVTKGNPLKMAHHGCKRGDTFAVGARKNTSRWTKVVRVEYNQHFAYAI